MSTKERFLSYIAFDTQSDPNSDTSPSTEKQKRLGEYLVKELTQIGIADAYLDQYGYVYAFLPTNQESKLTVGLIAHMDTAQEMPGECLNPKIISRWQGEDIELGNSLILSSQAFPILNKYRGHELITTDGTTLLGGDDKAGIAIIMETINLLVKEDLPRPNIMVVFTPDEEIGQGTSHFDYSKKMDFAYTLDGGPIDVINFENFNAWSAEITVEGKAIHPGDAKNKMVNSLLVAMELQSMLPAFENPAFTEKYEGFYHLTEMGGTVAQTKMHYIIRNHDETKIKQQLELMKSICSFLNQKYGANTVDLQLKKSYANMRPLLLERHEVLEYPIKALKRKGITASFEPIRGGTDGARLTFGGIPCPNLGTGSGNHHGPYEFASVDAMDKMTEVLVELMKIIALETND